MKKYMIWEYRWAFTKLSESLVLNNLNLYAFNLAFPYTSNSVDKNRTKQNQVINSWERDVYQYS